MRQAIGRKNEKSAFSRLVLEIDANRIGIPLPVQDKIDSFIANYLEPLLYESDAEKLSEMLAKTEDAWEKFARELHYYLML